MVDEVDEERLGFERREQQRRESARAVDELIELSIERDSGINQLAAQTGERVRELISHVMDGGTYPADIHPYTLQSRYKEQSLGAEIPSGYVTGAQLMHDIVVLTIYELGGRPVPRELLIELLQRGGHDKRMDFRRHTFFNGPSLKPNDWDGELEELAAEEDDAAYRWARDMIGLADQAPEQF